MGDAPVAIEDGEAVADRLENFTGADLQVDRLGLEEMPPRARDRGAELRTEQLEELEIASLEAPVRSHAEHEMARRALVSRGLDGHDRDGCRGLRTGRGAEPLAHVVEHPQR